MLKHKQVLANRVDNKLNEYKDIDSPISTAKNKTFRQLIIGSQTTSREKIFEAIERSQQGNLAAWAKRKHKKEAEVFASHMAAWLVSLHNSSVLEKLDPDVQKMVKSVEQRDGVPLRPEEVEVEDASKIKLDWFINIRELEHTREDDKSVTMDNVTMGSFGDKSFFSASRTQYSDEDFPEDAHQLLALHELDTITDDSVDELDHNAAVAFAQGSEGVEGYDKPSVPN